MASIIYRATSKITGKSYVGQTSKSLEERIKAHYKRMIFYKNHNRHLCHFYNALRKYRKEDWDWSIIAKVPTEDINEVEQLWIAGLNTFYNGYNSTFGGEGSVGGVVSRSTRSKMSRAQLGKVLSKEHRNKISLSRKNKKLTDEHKAKLSKAHTGKKLSIETKKRISMALTGRILSEEHKENLSKAKELDTE